MGLLNIVLFAALFASGYAEIVNTSACDENNADVCSFGEVRIDPCKGGETCLFKRGKNVSLSFDFTPNFSTSNLRTMVWVVQDGVELNIAGFTFGSTDACTYTSCPTVAGQTQTLNYKHHLESNIPKGKYNLKWKVWNKDDRNQTCCLNLFVILVDKEEKVTGPRRNYFNKY